MPSLLHEALVRLFRNRPRLAPELLEMALHLDVPEFSEARIESGDLTELDPAELRADLVVLLLHGKPVLGIVVEVQLARDDTKRFTWPAYAVGLRARFKCPACVLAVCADDAVAHWYARPIELGPGGSMTPLVLGPEGVPLITDPEAAIRDPELAVLSAMAHGRSPDHTRAAQVALAAAEGARGLDQGRDVLYFDLVYTSLSEAARKALSEMDPAKYKFQSEFANRYLDEGRAEGRVVGEASGRAAVVLKLLTLRFNASLDQSVVDRVNSASIEELDRWAERLLDAPTLEDVFR